MPDNDFNLTLKEKENIFSKVSFTQQVLSHVLRLHGAGHSEEMRSFLDQDEFHNHPHLILSMMKSHPRIYSYLPDKFKADSEIIKIFIGSEAGSIINVPATAFLSDLELTRFLLKNKGSLILKMPDEIRLSREFLEIALTSDGTILGEYPLRSDKGKDKEYWIREDKELAMLAISQTSKAIKHVSDRGGIDGDVMVHYVRSMKKADFSHLPASKMRNLDLLTETLVCFPSVFANLMEQVSSKDENIWNKIIEKLDQKPEEYFIECWQNYKFVNMPDKIKYFNKIVSCLPVEKLAELLRLETNKETDKYKVTEGYILEKHNDSLRKELEFIKYGGSTTQKNKIRKIKLK